MSDTHDKASSDALELKVTLHGRHDIVCPDCNGRSIVCLGSGSQYRRVWVPTAYVGSYNPRNEEYVSRFFRCNLCYCEFYEYKPDADKPEHDEREIAPSGCAIDDSDEDGMSAGGYDYAECRYDCELRPAA